MSGLYEWRKAQNPMHVLSLGAGQQSSDMYIRATLGSILPRPHYAIFADTGNERQRVYGQLWQLSEWAHRQPCPIPILIVRRGHIVLDSLRALAYEDQRWIGPNMFSGETGGPILKKCTREYKVAPKEKEIRRLMKAGGFDTVVDWRGLTMEELSRVKPDKRNYFYVRWPLLELRLRRGDCERHAFDVTGIHFTWSACKVCPARCADVRSMREIKENEPEAWKEIVEFDLWFRRLPGMRSETFLNRQLVPMSQMDLSLASDNYANDLFGCESDSCGL